MTSERIQRRIEQLLDEADQALVDGQWDVVRDRAQKALALDPDNLDAETFFAAAERAVASVPPASSPPSPGTETTGRGVQLDALSESSAPEASAADPGDPNISAPSAVNSLSAHPEPTSAVHPELVEGRAAQVQPTSFANGRYAVKRFLGEGGKKKVYLAHDTLLDRDVAFALIKTEGLDPSTSSGQAALERITPRGPGNGSPRRPSAHRHRLRYRD